MVLGIGLLVVGYAVLYWGIHHFQPTDPNANWPRYSLWCLLKLQSMGLPTFKPLQWDVPNSPPPTSSGGNNPESTNKGSGGKVTKNAPTNWQEDILKSIKAPINPLQIAKMSAWNSCEGNASGQSGLPINNPFNTTRDCCGGTSVNSVGVKAYPTWSAGVNATMESLNMPFAAKIKQNLMTNGSGQDFAISVGTSGWGTNGSCIGGYFVAAR